MAHNKDVKYVGDSRVRADKQKLRPRPYSEYPGRTEQFFPNFLLKEWMVAVVVLVAFLMLVVAQPAPLEPTPANPNEDSYIPLPDWYFLFLYQFLKYFPGDWKIIGSIVIPGIFGLAFLLAPWLDRGPERRPSKRPISTGIMLVTIIGIVALTYLSIVDHEKQLQAAGGTEQPQQEQNEGVAGGTDNAFDAAGAYAASCVACHGGNLEGGVGPSLVGLSLSAEEVAAIIQNGIPASDKFPTGMPAGVFKGSEEDRLALANWILDHK